MVLGRAAAAVWVVAGGGDGAAAGVSSAATDGRCKALLGWCARAASPRDLSAAMRSLSEVACPSPGTLESFGRSDGFAASAACATACQRPFVDGSAATEGLCTCSASWDLLVPCSALAASAAFAVERHRPCVERSAATDGRWAFTCGSRSAPDSSAAIRSFKEEKPALSTVDFHLDMARKLLASARGGRPSPWCLLTSAPPLPPSRCVPTRFRHARQRRTDRPTDAAKFFVRCEKVGVSFIPRQNPHDANHFISQRCVSVVLCP